MTLPDGPKAPKATQAFNILNEVRDEIRQDQLETLWKVIEHLEGYGRLKTDVEVARGKYMQVVLYRPPDNR